MPDKMLRPGDAWLGFFGFPPTSDRRVGMLKRDGSSIQLHSPEEGTPEDVLAALGPLQEPPLPVEGYAHFGGPEGKATLIGLKTWPAMLSLHKAAASVMRGITADAAVFGADADVDYRAVHAMRSRIEGLEGFYRYSTVEVNRDPDGRFSVTVEGQQEEHVFPDGGLLVQTSARVNTNSSGTHTLHEYMQIVSRTEQPEDYQNHLEMHRFIADLLTALNDLPCHVYDIEVNRQESGDDWHPMALASDGNRPRYRPVDTALPVAGRGDLPDDCLFRWMVLYSEWHRELRPLAHLPRLRDAFIDAQFSQLGVGLEGLGYRLGLEQKLAKKQAADLRLKRRLGLIVKDLGPAAAHIPDDLPQEIPDAYNGIKHANRESPTPELLEWLLPQGVGLFQLWLTRRLGAPDEYVESLAVQMFPG